MTSRAKWPVRAVLIAAAAATPVFAADKSFLVQNGSWGVFGNWAPLGAPTAADNAFIGNSAGAENGNVTLNMNASAANLVMTDGMEILTNGNRLTVGGSTSVAGRNETPANVVYYSRLRVQPGGGAYGFRTTNLTISDRARLWIDGGTARIDNLLDLQADSWIDGDGVINLYGNGAVAFRNNGRIGPNPGGLTINQLGTGRIDLDGTIADNGLINITTGTLDGSPFASLTINGDGLADDYNERFWIAGGNTLTMNLSEGWTLGMGSEVRFFPPSAGDDGVARINGATLTVQGNLLINQNGHARFNAPVVMSGTASVPANGTLEFNGETTLNGATLTKAGGTILFDGATTVINGTINSATPGVYAGLAYFNGPTDFRGTLNLPDVASAHAGQQTVSLPAVINGLIVDMDGGDGTVANWSINAPLTVNATAIDGGGSNQFDDVMTVNATSFVAPAHLEIHVQPGSWTLGGTLNLNGPAGILANSLRGDRLRVAGTVNVNGANSTSALISVLDGGAVNIGSGAWQLDGGSLLTTNTIEGGVIQGSGELRAATGRAMVGRGTIDVQVDFDGTAELRAKSGFLNIDSTIEDVGILGTADDSGVLQVNNPWNTSVADNVQLLGGQLRGAAVNNDRMITGRGTVFVNSLVNAGSITAVGGTLVVNTLTDTIDLDGGLGTGRLNAVQGDLLVADLPTDPFDGRAFVGFGRTLTLAEGWFLGSAGTLELGGATGQPATVTGSAQILEGDVVVSGPGRFDINSQFTASSSVVTSAVGDSLELVRSGQVYPGASFSGPGTLRVVNGGTLMLVTDSTVGISVVNEGVLRVDTETDTGIVSAQRFTQTGSGVTRMQIRGTVPGPGYDRLSVATSAALSGRLELGLLGGYDPEYLQPHEIIRADAVVGAFDGVPGNMISPAKYWAVTYDQDSVFATAALPGDANLDGSVNIGDFAILASNFNTPGTWVDGNFNGDLRTDIGDFSLQATNFNTSIPGGLPEYALASVAGGARARAVPEPAGLLAFGAAVLGLRRRRMM